MTTKKVVKLVLVMVMLAGLSFALSNFLAVKSEAYAIWQKLEMGTDVVTDEIYIKCWGKDGGCCTVSPYPF